MPTNSSLTDRERARLTALKFNEERRTQGLPGFQVDIIKNGDLADIQAVYAQTVREAETFAMMQTPLSFRGEMVTYSVRPLDVQPNQQDAA